MYMSQTKPYTLEGILSILRGNRYDIVSSMQEIIECLLRVQGGAIMFVSCQ